MGNVGVRSHETPTLHKTSTPIWGDEGWADYFIYNQKQRVSVDVFDNDMIPKHVSLIGRLDKVRIYDLLTKPDHWWPIYDKQSDNQTIDKGKVRIEARAYSLRSDAS